MTMLISEVAKEFHARILDRVLGPRPAWWRFKARREYDARRLIHETYPPAEGWRKT